MSKTSKNLEMDTEVLEVMEKKFPPVTVHATLEGVVSVPFTINATGQNSNSNTDEGCIRLIHGRTYYIPVDTDADSDSYGNLKIFSNVADKIDIRFVKQKFCAIIPIQHNVKIQHGQQLCILWNN
jgi:hypothetical protein